MIYKFDNDEVLSVARREYAVEAESLPAAWDAVRRLHGAGMLVLRNREEITRQGAGREGG